MVEYTSQHTTNGVAQPFPATAIDVDSIPEELKELNQWVCWRLEHRPNSPKPTKVPLNPSTGSRASSTNPRTWARFERAVSFYNAGHCDGIGFVFTPNVKSPAISLDNGQLRFPGIWDFKGVGELSTPN